MVEFDKSQPYKDKLDFDACLGHSNSTPKEWCSKINECQRNIALRHHKLSDEETVHECMCNTLNFEGLLK